MGSEILPHASAGVVEGIAVFDYLLKVASQYALFVKRKCIAIWQIKTRNMQTAMKFLTQPDAYQRHYVIGGTPDDFYPLVPASATDCPAQQGDCDPVKQERVRKSQERNSVFQIAHASIETDLND